MENLRDLVSDGVLSDVDAGNEILDRIIVSNLHVDTKDLAPWNDERVVRFLAGKDLFWYEALWWWWFVC